MTLFAGITDQRDRTYDRQKRLTSYDPEVKERTAHNALMIHALEQGQLAPAQIARIDRQVLFILSEGDEAELAVNTSFYAAMIDRKCMLVDVPCTLHRVAVDLIFVRKIGPDHFEQPLILCHVVKAIRAKFRGRHTCRKSGLSDTACDPILRLALGIGQLKSYELGDETHSKNRLFFSAPF